MAESVTVIGLGLETSSLLAGSRIAIDGLRQIETQARQTQAVLSTLSISAQQHATSLQAAAPAATAFATGLSAATTATTQQTTASQLNTAALQSHNASLLTLVTTQQQTVVGLSTLTAAQTAQTAAQQAAIAAHQQAAAAQAAHRAQIQQTAAASQQWQTILGGARLALGALGVQLGLSGLVQLGKEIITTGAEMEQLRASLAATSGGARAGGESFVFLSNLGFRLGVNVQSLVKDFTGLTAATRGTSLAGDESRRIFEAITTAVRVTGGSQQQLHGALLAVEQMISKGTVSMEELRRQLGNALPGAFEVAARAMGKTTAEMNQLVASGQLLATDFVPRFTRQLLQEFAPGVETATKTATTAFTNLENEWYALKNRIAQSGPLAFVTSVAGGIAERLHATTEAEQQLESQTRSRLGPGADVATAEELQRARTLQREMNQLREIEENRRANYGLPAIVTGMATGWTEERLAEDQKVFETLRAQLEARRRFRELMAEEEAAEAKTGAGALGQQVIDQRRQDEERLKRIRDTLSAIPGEVANVGRVAALTPSGFDGLETKLKTIQKHLQVAIELTAKLSPDAIPADVRATIAQRQQEVTMLQSQIQVRPVGERLGAMRARMAEEPEQAESILRQQEAEFARDQRRLEAMRARMTRTAGGTGGGLPAEELATIERLAAQQGIDPQFLRALRQTERGGPGREFGVLSVSAPTYEDQARIAAERIAASAQRFTGQGGALTEAGTDRYSAEFIKFFSAAYAPAGAANDPRNLNQYHAGNLARLYGGVGGEPVATGFLPEAAQKAEELRAMAEAEGIRLRITSTFRTRDEQAQLYAQGRTTPGSIVTNAPPGTSRHESGRAFDVVPLNVEGQPEWGSPQWERVGAMGRSLGLEWGGDWKTFKDRPHFQLPGGAGATAGAASGTPETAENVQALTVRINELSAARAQLQGQGQLIGTDEEAIKRLQSLETQLAKVTLGEQRFAETEVARRQAQAQERTEFTRGLGQDRTGTEQLIQGRITAAEAGLEEAKAAVEAEKDFRKQRQELWKSLDIFGLGKSPEEEAALKKMTQERQRATQSLQSYEDQLGLTPEGGRITRENRALLRAREQLAPLEGTEMAGRRETIMKRLEEQADPIHRQGAKLTDLVLGTWDQILSGSKPTLAQIGQSFARMLNDMLLETFGVKEQMNKAFGDLLKAGTDWLKTALGIGTSAAGGFAGGGRGTTAPAGGSSGTGSGWSADWGEAQYGGPVSANAPYLVGERGPELFVPRSSGTVIPADQTAAMLGGGGQQTINLHIYGVTDAQSFVRSQGQINRALSGMTKSGVRDS